MTIIIFTDTKYSNLLQALTDISNLNTRLTTLQDDILMKQSIINS